MSQIVHSDIYIPRAVLENVHLFLFSKKKYVAILQLKC